jgi:CRISPR-associated protein Cmr1
METITFECEVITPMFLAGADGQKPELRPPSIKGAMRFWWRAMNGHMSIDVLREKEAAIFGGTGKNRDSSEQGKSSFSIRIKEDFPEDSILSIKNKEYNDYINELKKYPGISYLYYSVIAMNKREFFLDGKKAFFDLTVSKNDIPTDLIQTLLLVSLFGGFGSRSRRGAGNILISTQNEKYKSMLDLSHINTREELQKFIIKSFDFKVSKNNSYSILKKSNLIIYTPQDNWKDALETIAFSFNAFRKKKESEITSTPNFGFPIQHRSSNTTMIAKKGREKIERRSSPLIFRIVKTNDSTYFPIILWLKGDLIPDDYQIMDKFGRNTADPSNDIIQEFIDTLKFEEITL